MIGKSRSLFFGSARTSLIPGKFEKYHPRFSGICDYGAQEVFSTQETEETFDPSRLSPKEYLANADCRSVIIKELNGLLSPDKSGFAPLVVVNRMQKPYLGRSIVK